MPYSLSKSTLSILKECPRCFWLHMNERMKRPAGIFPSLPSGMDKVLKQHFDAFRDKNALPPELKSVDGVALFKDKELLNVWSNNFKGIVWKDEEGNTFKGAVDYVLAKGKKLIVLDFKTRGFALKDDTAGLYQDQLDIYNLLLRKNGHHTEEYAYLLFYYPEAVDSSGHFLFHADLVKRQISTKNAERIFKEAIAVLKGALPEPTESCAFCQWSRLKI